MFTAETVVQRFWERVFHRPDATVLLVTTPGDKTTLLPVSSRNAGLAVATIAAFLQTSGISRGDRVAVMGWNSPEWLLADIAIQSLGAITVPIYPHSTPEQVNYVLKDSGAKVLFSNESEQLAKVAAGSACVPVHFDTLVHGISERRESPPRSFMQVFSASDSGLPEVGANALSVYSRMERDTTCGVTRDDIATVIYTSGSTGVPKGVVLTHGSFAAACEGLLSAGFDLKPENDIYLSYLPLAHVYERACGALLCVWTGVPMAFCKVDELADAIKIVRPTVVHGVPAVWRKIKDKVESKLAEATGLKARLIKWAFAQKNPGFRRKIADRLVFAKVRAELGGRLRICTSGGAPISPEIIEFYNAVGIQLLQGYGLTETTGASFVNRPTGQNKVGSVGLPIGGLSYRIVPVAGQEESGEGEIQFSGPTVTKGYWNLPLDTAKTFTEDGWFRTGDRGRIDADGYLFITGRIKRLLKTDGGKYVAPEKIEKAFEPDPIVQYVVAVGDGKPFISGLIFINQQLASELLAKNGQPSVPQGIDAATFYAQQPLVQQAVQDALAHANAKLERWEQLKKVHIIPVEATIAAGLLTPTLKIRTEEVLKRYAEEIAAFYRK